MSARDAMGYALAFFVAGVAVWVWFFFAAMIHGLFWKGDDK